MITIKFRGYSKDFTENEWFFGNLIDKGNGIFQILEKNPKIWDLSYDGITVIPESIGQFTGLHDKNGKEIYTGDILQLKRLDGSILLYKIFSVKGGFAFNAHQDDFYKPQSEIYFYESTSDMQSSSFISSLEIIGNIYENPELLENKIAN